MTSDTIARHKKRYRKSEAFQTVSSKQFPPFFRLPLSLIKASHWTGGPNL